MNKMLRLFFPFVILLAACGGKSNENLTHLRLAVGYKPDIQFAPLYAAIEKGYFASEGLDIELVYQDETLSTQLIGAGELQFAVVSGEQVPLARAQGVPVVYVAAWYQKYPVSVISKAELGISSPSDLRGRKIGLPGLYGANYIGLDALLFAGGLKESDVTLNPIGYTQRDALEAGREEIVAVYTANEPVQLRAAGVELNELRVADYAALVANGLVTNEKTIAENPDLVKRMVSGFLRGLKYTIDNPDKAYEICLGYVENLAQLDKNIQEQILATSIELWKAERPGYTDPQTWENMQTVLLNMGLLTEPLDLSKAFTNEFIP